MTYQISGEGIPCSVQRQHACVSALAMVFNDILDTFKDENRRIQL